MHAQLARNLDGMLSASAAVRQHCKLTRIDALIDGQPARGLSHVGVDDTIDASGRLLHRDAEAMRDWLERCFGLGSGSASSDRPAMRLR